MAVLCATRNGDTSSVHPWRSLDRGSCPSDAAKHDERDEHNEQDDDQLFHAHHDTFTFRSPLLNGPSREKAAG
jgi:hypothetical protein